MKRLTLVLTASLLSACSLGLSDFTFGSGDGGGFDGGPEDGGFDAATQLDDAGDARDAGIDAAPPDAGVDAAVDGCVATSEVCDGLDNDCDGVVDEGTAAELGCAWSCGALACADPAVPAAGDRFTCARLTDGTVTCWGDNTFGQLGDSTVIDHRVPMNVVSLAGVEDLAVGASSACALRRGRLSCWGDNWTYQLGDGSIVQSAIPLELSLSDVRAFDVGGVIEEIAEVTAETVLGACAIVGPARTVYCWGGWNETGLLRMPTPVALTDGTIEVAVGGGFACARDPLSSGPKCWGTNFFGQLGNGTTTSTDTPTRVSSAGGGVEEIAAGAWHACGIFSGDVFCWGYNLHLQCGQPDRANVLEPARVATVSGVIQLALGGMHSCALLGTGEVYCWGQNTSGQLGDGTSTPSSMPVRVSGVSTAVAITAGFTHTCATLIDGTMVCWGANDFAQLGDGTVTQRTAPVAVVPLE